MTFQREGCGVFFSFQGMFLFLRVKFYTVDFNMCFKCISNF